MLVPTQSCKCRMLSLHYRENYVCPPKVLGHLICGLNAFSCKYPSTNWENLLLPELPFMIQQASTGALKICCVTGSCLYFSSAEVKKKFVHCILFLYIRTPPVCMQVFDCSVINHCGCWNGGSRTDKFENGQLTLHVNSQTTSLVHRRRFISNYTRKKRHKRQETESQEAVGLKRKQLIV